MASPTVRMFSYALAVGAGLLVGGLFAPRAGDASRKLLARRAQKMKKVMRSRVHDGTRYISRHGSKAREQALDWMDRGKDVYRAAGKLVQATF